MLVRRGVLAAVAAGLVVLATGAASPSAAPTGLVAAFGFNEGSGSSVADSSGTGNNGSVVNATWAAGGKFGSALSFSASRSSYVNVPSSASLQLTALTVEAWVNPSSLSGSWRTVV